MLSVSFIIRSRSLHKASAIVVWAPLLFSQWVGRWLSCSLLSRQSFLCALRLWSHLLTVEDSALRPSMYFRYASECRRRWGFGGGATKIGGAGCWWPGWPWPGYGGGACCPGPYPAICMPYGFPGPGLPFIPGTITPEKEWKKHIFLNMEM